MVRCMIVSSQAIIGITNPKTTYSIIYYVNIIPDLRLFDLHPLFFWNATRA